jgi:hypothetical protein
MTWGGAPPDRPARDRHLEVESTSGGTLEAVVGPVDLVDQEHGRVFRRDRLEQRPLEQVLAREDDLLRRVGVHALLPCHPQAEHLPRVVPFVEGRVDVQPLVALEPDQRPAGEASEHLGDLGLSHAGVALDEKRLSHFGREIERRRDRGLGDVALARHRLLDLGDLGSHAPAPAADV